MGQRRTSGQMLVGLVFAGLAVPTTAHAVLINLTLVSAPSRDGTVSESVAGSGVFNVLDTSGISMFPRVGIAAAEITAQVGLMEFEISSIPSGSTIDSVSITLTKGTTILATAHTVDFLGYAGDGVLALADAMVAATPLTTATGFTIPAADVTYDLGTGFLQSILGTTDFAGIRMQSNDLGAIFNTTESIFTDPTLTVEYTPGAAAVPEPTGLALLGLSAAAFCGVRLRRRREPGRAPTPTPQSAAR